MNGRYLHEFAVQTHVEFQVLFSHLLRQFETHRAILVVDPPFLIIQENSLGMVDLFELWVGRWEGERCVGG